MSTSLYIHIPYCRSRCFYCDFYSGDARLDDRYIDAVLTRVPNEVFETVYIGGGTPSLLTTQQLKRLCEGISCHGEFTVEGNPESLSAEFLNTALLAGVNRLSIGIQSLNDRSLAAIGRRHSAQQAINTITAAKTAGFDNISVDLMVGIPHQDTADIDHFVATAAQLKLAHISCYMLKLEQGVPLYKSIDTLPNADEVAELYEHAVLVMKRHGFLRYEFSNFARDNSYSRHNLRYWDCCDYLGIGPSAHSCINGKRFYYPPDTAAFIDGCQPIDDGVSDATDYIMLGTRLQKGISLATLKQRFGYSFSAEQQKKLRFFEHKGLLTITGDNLTLTDRGLMLQNSILVDILF